MFKKMINAFKEKPVVEFSSLLSYIDSFPHPVAAHKKMPEWYRKLKPALDNQPVSDAGSAKRCIPVLDAVSQGYVIPLWADLHVEVVRKTTFIGVDGSPLADVHYAGDLEEMIGKVVDDIPGAPTIARAVRGDELSVRMSMPFEKMFDGSTIEGHSWEQVGDLCDLKKFKLGKTLLKFVNPWSIKTPPGWSVAFKNPASNFSNDIHIIEGVVDTDEYTVPVNFPFVWTGSEEGEWIIPKGTPLVQIVPFKRTETDMVVTVRDEKKVGMIENKLITAHFDRYKTMFWHKRDKYTTKDIER